MQRLLTELLTGLKEELGQKITVVATGGLARKIIPHCKREILLDEDLLLKGLLIIYEKNKKNYKLSESENETGQNFTVMRF